MSTRPIRTAALALSAAALLAMPVAANGYREKGKVATIAGSTLSVTPPRDWNLLSIRPGKKAETWTLDGERLNEITWYAGIKPDEPLIRETSRKHKPLPRLKRATLIAEIPELLEATYRTERSVADFQLTSATPDPFLGQPGIRFTYAYVDTDHLPRRGEARAALIGGRLYLATFDAPRQHFFDRSLADFRALTDAAKLS
ncbi:hypothetical protein QLH51_00915 [Sphingomonas sp. 2R-10]|uniref:hypothetical protein n=1 Tax=Sphingomonas sp. 2R-10 TaxID=3045148 RepID=UPI0019D00D86|nr:hypothetical protein [Sphingomonas sp. 2R-10]MDJ0275367.1 hypothetical protein [Sphingomonas sp. 2R-10]